MFYVVLLISAVIFMASLFVARFLHQPDTPVDLYERTEQPWDEEGAA